MPAISRDRTLEHRDGIDLVVVSYKVVIQSSGQVICVYVSACLCAALWMQLFWAVIEVNVLIMVHCSASFTLDVSAILPFPQGLQTTLSAEVYPRYSGPSRLGKGKAKGRVYPIADRDVCLCICVLFRRFASSRLEGA